MCEVETAQERGTSSNRNSGPRDSSIRGRCRGYPARWSCQGAGGERGIFDGGERTFIGGERIAARDARYLHEAIGSRIGNGYSCKGRSAARSQAKLKLHWQAVRAIRQQAWTKRSSDCRGQGNGGSANVWIPYDGDRGRQGGKNTGVLKMQAQRKDANAVEKHRIS
jgi:hypothetical protein